MTFQMTQPFGGYSFGNHFIGDVEMGRWGDGEMGKAGVPSGELGAPTPPREWGLGAKGQWGDGEMGGVWEKSLSVFPLSSLSSLSGLSPLSPLSLLPDPRSLFPFSQSPPSQGIRLSRFVELVLKLDTDFIFTSGRDRTKNVFYTIDFANGGANSSCIWTFVIGFN